MYTCYVIHAIMVKYIIRKFNLCGLLLILWYTVNSCGLLFGSVVCVGGDGMFTEIVHGLLNRMLKENSGTSHPTPGQPLYSPQVRIGIIPAGL